MSKWNENVLTPAYHIVSQFLKNEKIDSQIKNKLEKVNNLENMLNLKRSNVKQAWQWKNYECQFCDKKLHGDNEYQEHLKSNKHKKRMASLNKKQSQNHS